MNIKSNKASYILAISQFSLAAALIYFTYEVSRLTTQIPEILASIEHTSKKIEPVLSEIAEIRAQIPPTLKEIEEVRKQVPAVLKEVEQFRKLLPSILAEVKAVRQQVPLVLTEAKLYRKQISVVLEEVKEVRILIPDVLAEVERTREAIPPMLAQGERMIGEARVAGKQASEGAVTGVITGIFKAPFKLFGSLGRSMFRASSKKIDGLTDDDENLATQAAVTVLETGKLGESLNWKNPDSGNDGTVKIKDIKLIERNECRVINSIVRINGKEKINTDVTACLNEDSEWKMLDE